MDPHILDRDFAARRSAAGLYIIQQFCDGHFVAVPDHGGQYDEDEAKRRLAILRPLGDGWIEDVTGGFHLVEP